MITRVGLFNDSRKKNPWVVRWFGEYDPATGRRKRYSKSFRLKREAESFQAGKQAMFDKGGKRDNPSAIELGAFCEKYMRRRQHEWAEKTRRHIEDLGIRLTKYFGADFPLRSVTADQASMFWSKAKMMRSGFETRELSRFSRNRLLRDCKTMFRHAVEWADLGTNPFAGIKLIRVGKRNRRKWHYITPRQYVALLQAAPTLQWKVFYALAYTSAARFGELFNLTEENVDFVRGRLVIASRDGTEKRLPFRVKDHEDREIPLPSHTLKIIAGWLKNRPKGSPFILLTPERFQRVLQRWRRCREAGLPWINDYMVNNVLRDIRAHAKNAGLKLDAPLTVHSFRKSCGQNWADHLPMNVVKELMGHANISTTAEFYSTVSEDHESRAQWVIEAITFGQASHKSDAQVTPDRNLGLIRKVG